MRYLVERDVTYEKVWFELQALAWNRPELRERLARRQRRVARSADGGVRRSRTASSGSSMPLDALVSLVMTFNIGIIVERLGGHRDRPRRAARVDRRMAVELTDEPGRTSRRGPATRTSRATSSATASASSTRSTARASRRCCCCRPGRSSTRATGRCRSPTSRATAACVTFDGRGNGRSDRPAERRGLRRARVRRRRAGGHGRDGDGARRDRRLSLGAQRALLLAAEHPERVDGAVFIAPH